MESPFQSLGRRVDNFVYSGVIKIMGGGATAYGSLADHYEARQWHFEANETLKKAAALCPLQALYPLRISRNCIKMGRFAEAMEYCQKAIALESHLGEAYFVQGVLQGKASYVNLMLNSYRIAMACSLKDPAAIGVIAKAFSDAGLYEEAVGAYEEIVRISPRNVSAYGVMADTYTKLKRFPEALEAYRHAVELKPSADAYGILASAYARAGQYQKAVQAYQKAMKLEPGFSQAWNRLSEIYVRLEDFENRSASGTLDTATRSMYAKLQQEQAALENFKETIRQRPQDPQGYLEMGQLYLEKLQIPDKALEYLKHALRMKAGGSQIHRLLGDAQAALRHHHDARRSFERALQLDKGDALVWSSLGNLHAKLGKFDESVRCYQEALKLKPQNAGLHRQMGDHLRRIGRVSEATRFYWQAIHLNPLDAEARFGLGLTYVRLNQRSYAIEQKAILRTIDAKLAADLDHVIWRLTRTSQQEL